MAAPITAKTALTPPLVAGDLIYIVRPSLGAAGSFKMTVEDFMQAAGDLLDKWVYVVGGMMLEPQPANALIAIAVPTEDITIPSAFNRSAGKATIAATSSTTFSIKKNGVEFGTMTVGAGLSVPSFNYPSDTSFTAGTDYISVYNPAAPDATLAGFGFGIWGRRT